MNLFKKVLTTILMTSLASTLFVGNIAHAELAPMTEEEITLTFASWAHSDMKQLQAERFMEKYPNITVEIIDMQLDGYMDTLSNLAAAGEMPDAFWYLGNVDVPIVNGWLGDMTEYWENDPESEDVLVTLQDKGYLDGERKLAAAVAYQPYTIFLDEAVFEKLNVPMPSTDWTYDEMIELMQTMTVPEQGIFGYNDFTLLLTMAPIVKNDAEGEFGWNGETFDMTGEWAEALSQQAEYIRTGVHAPLFDSDEAEAVFGDRLMWSASSGRIAMQLDAWWTKDLFNSKEFTDKGIKFVPYPVPRGENATTLHKPAFVDMGGISSATEHPREAYELLKFMGWGSDGWSVRLEAFDTLVDDSGNKVFPYPEGLPLVQNEELWDKVAAGLPDNPYYGEFLQYAKEPIPLSGAVIPGFQTFLEEVYFNGEYGNVEQAAAAGELNPNDIAKELTDLLNQYHEAAMREIF
ncbi:ABC transporter substrate-binding protein [Globicatella sp. PHS-GS-PNBC-21-1553]|uniref:ABC transporter substrate-binding protein n=1 Tax=Globicatella sp. PHS-GS-PNBC-21-1553 TaxID=2885764 RepID=UPI00298F16E2|nr:extracellular solute-binding protein [Globicatella sp. PHS-GS-PNBC-21-1553]WPC09645.1 extracellular solute-binding protein [Globicatella sp. PHS-GS-PNBC-21-1553]